MGKKNEVPIITVVESDESIDKTVENDVKLLNWKCRIDAEIL